MNGFIAPDQESFDRDGFAIVDSLIDPGLIPKLHERFDAMFAGEFETGVVPDEVNWQTQDSDPALTRQICNAWKGDRLVAATLLSARLGETIAKLAGWPGARIMQDNLLWKPPGARSLGFHRDAAFSGWYTPQEMMTCWIALDPTTADGGTVEFAVGSHTWSTNRDPAAEFHAPDDYRESVRLAAVKEGADLNVHYVEVAAGAGSFHHGWLWHGSGANTTSRHRRALVLHCGSSDTSFVRSRFHEGTGPIYTKYAHQTNDEMDEKHFPILWTADGYRTPGI